MNPIKEYRYFIEYTDDINKVIVSIQEKKTFVYFTLFGFEFTTTEWHNVEQRTINPTKTKKYKVIENVLEPIYNEKLKRENTVMHNHIFSNYDNG